MKVWHVSVVFSVCEKGGMCLIKKKKGGGKNCTAVHCVTKSESWASLRGKNGMLVNLKGDRYCIKGSYC